LLKETLLYSITNSPAIFIEEIREFLSPKEFVLNRIPISIGSNAISAHGRKGINRKLLPTDANHIQLLALPVKRRTNVVTATRKIFASHSNLLQGKTESPTGSCNESELGRGSI